MSFGEEFLKTIKQKIDDELNPKFDKVSKSILLNNDLLNKIISFIRVGKNAEDDDAIQNYILHFNYKLDIDDLLKNKDKWIKEQNYRDFLIQILQNLTINSKEKKEMESFLIEMFKTSKFDIEKKQIADFAKKNLNVENFEFKKKINKFCHDFTSDDKRNIDELISIKTNGFFSDVSINRSYKDKVRERNSIFNAIIETLRDEGSDLYYDIKSVFSEKNDNDTIEDMQLKKIKIYLLLKTINSQIYKKSNLDKKKQLINNVLDKEYSDFNVGILTSFCENCDFDINVFINDNNEETLSSVNEFDLISNLNDVTGSVQKKKIDDIFENVLFDEIDFFEINNKDIVSNNEYFYFKFSTDSRGKRKLLLCFNTKQKELLLAAIYSHSDICDKIANSENRTDNSVDVFDFAKICKATNMDPMPTNSYKDVYDKYYLHEESKGLGALSNDQHFSIKNDSNENFIRNDCSEYIISTEVLLGWLKIQAKSAKPLHEMKVVISDIENLPEMLKEYYNFIYNQKNIVFNKNLTPVDNLVIKNIKILSKEEIFSLFEDLDNSKVCFKSLKIDDPIISDFVSSNVEIDDVKNKSILYGYNNNYYSDINILKKQKQKDGDVFNFGKKYISSEIKVINEEGVTDDDFAGFQIKEDFKEKEQLLNDIIDKKLDSDKANVNNDIELNVDVAVDVDMDIEFLLNLNKPVEVLDNLNENDLITYKNVDQKIDILLSPGSKRFSEKTKEFLTNIKKKINNSFKELFLIVTNRKYLCEPFKEIDFKSSNFNLTPEAFVSLVENFLYGGFVKWNGNIGNQKLSIFQVNNKKGTKKYVVGMTATGINYGYVHPIEEMFTFIPTNTVGLTEDDLKKKYENVLHEIRNNYSILLQKVNSLGEYENIKNIFVKNPKDSGLEYEKYISDNEEEIFDFLDFLNNHKRDGYINICEAVCSNFCLPINIGSIHLKKSLINPVNFLRGMKKVFSLLDDLKMKGFIDNDFVKKLPKILDKNKYSIQVVYELLLKQKINVERMIIAYRNSINGIDKQSVDINDIKDVEKYFNQEDNYIDNFYEDKEGLEQNDVYYQNNESCFSYLSFNGILNYNNIISKGKKTFNYWNDIVYIDEELESGGLFVSDEIKKSKSVVCTMSIENRKFTNISYSLKNGFDEEDKLYSDYLKLCYFLNKKRNRMSDGTIDEPNLTIEQKLILDDKVKILPLLDSLMMNFDNSDTVEYKKLYIIVNLYLSFLDGKNYNIRNRYDFESILSLEDGIIDQIYNEIKDDKNNENTFLQFLLIDNDNDDKNQDAKKILIERIEQIKSKELPSVLEGTNGKEFEIKFAVKMYMLYSEIVRNNNYDNSLKYEKRSIKPVLDFYAERYVTKTDSIMYKLYKKYYLLYNEEKKNNEIDNVLVMHINMPDNTFENILGHYYLNKEMRENFKVNDEKIIRDITEYCVASDNNGKYSVLSEFEKKNIEKSDNNMQEYLFEEYSNYFSKYVLKFKKIDTFDIINLAHESAKKGLNIIELLKAIDKIEIKAIDEEAEIEEETKKAIYAYILQKIYLKTLEKSKVISLNDLLSFCDIINAKYSFLKEKFKERDDKTLSVYKRNIDNVLDGDINEIVYFLSSDIIDLSQKKFLLLNSSDNTEEFSLFLKNFSKLLSTCDDILNENDKKQPIKFGKINIQKIVAKVYSKYTDIIKYPGSKYKKQIEIDKIDNMIKFIFERVNLIRITYDKAVATNNKLLQSTMLNLFGKLLLLLENFSIEDINKIFIIIGNNLTSDSDILNKFSFIVEHIKECKDRDLEYLKDLYENITKLYDLSDGEKYLNSGATLEELFEIADHLEEKKEEVLDVTQALNESKKIIIEDFKNDISKKGGFLGKNNTFVERIDKTLTSIISGCSNFVDNLYNKESSGRKILEKINKKYSDELPLETLFRDESLSLFESDDLNVSSDVRKIIRYVNELTAVYMNNLELVDSKISEYEQCVISKKKIDAASMLNFIAAFCVKHIKDQNKTLRCNQLTAVMLRNFKALSQGFDVDNKSTRKFCLLPTGSGKTLTILFDLYLADLKGKTPFAITTNNLLVNEMMNDAEKNSMYKNHIFYLNENQDLIEKSTNRKVQIDEILDILKDRRNVFFSSYKDFSFWVQKLLLNGGKFGFEIVKHLKNNGHVALDELDSIADANTSNKISISSTADSNDYHLACAMQELYNSVKNNERNIKNLKQLIVDYKYDIRKQGEYYELIEKIINLVNVKVLKYDNLEDEEKVKILSFLNSCIEANNMREGAQYTVTTNAITGVSLYYPIKNGEPDKSGSKFSTDIDLALKVKLKLNNNCYFDDLTKKTQVVSEASNFRIFNYVSSVFGVSGTIRGANEIWRQEGFDIDDIKPKDVKNIKYIKTPYSITEDSQDYKNDTLDLLFLISAVANRNDIENNDLHDAVFEFISNKYSYSNDIILYLQNQYVQHVNELKKENYFLTFMRDSNELESFTKRLQNNLDEIERICVERDIDFYKPEIMILDKKQQLIDDQVVKEKLSNEHNNLFVFALQDRSRGFDFPRSPNLITTGIFDIQLDGQILGRTGRNNKPGTIIKAYSICENDYVDLCKENSQRVELDDNIVNYLMKKKSNDIITKFRHKKHYFDVIAEVSEKISIFLNIATSELDNDYREKTYNDAYKVSSKFIEMINDRWKKFTEPTQPEHFSHSNYTICIQKFRKEVMNDLEKNVFKLLYEKCCFFSMDNKKNLKDLIEEVNIKHSELINTQVAPIQESFGDEKYKEIENKEEIFKQNVAKISQSKQQEFIDLNTKDNNITFKKEDILNHLSGKEKTIFTILSCLEVCGYDINEYSKLIDNEVNNDFLSYSPNVIIGKKKIFDNLQPSGYEEREIVVIKDENIDDDIKTKLSTLSKNSMMIRIKNDGKIEFSYIKDFFDKKNNRKLLMPQNNSVSNDIDNLNCFLTTKMIKKFSEDGDIDYDTDFNDIINIEYGKTKNKSSNLDVDGNVLNQEFKNDIETQISGYIKNGILKADKSGNLVIKNSESINYKRDKLFLPTKEEIDEKNIFFVQKLNEYSEFNLEPNEIEKKYLDEDNESLLTILKKKIISIIDNIETLKSDIQDCNDIQYDKKKELLKKCDSIISKENIVNNIKRALSVISFSAFSQELTNDSDKLKDNLNIDNFEEAELDYQELITNSKSGEEFATKVNDISNDEENNLKKSLYLKHNDVVENINFARNKLDKIKNYKQELEFIDYNKLSFKSFNSKQSLMATKNEIKSNINKYINFVNHISSEDESVFSKRQKEQLKSEAIAKHIDNAINLIITPNNINKLFNEFSLENNDPENNKSIGKYELKLINGIVNLYKKKFGAISKANGGDLIEIVKNNYDPNNELEYNDSYFDEVFEEYKKDLNDFKEQIKKMLFSYQKDKIDNEGLYKDDDTNEDEKKFLPITTYNFFNSMLTYLGKNYKSNLEKHDKIKKDIINTIISVFHFFKSNISGIHNEFRHDLTNIFKKYVPNYSDVINEDFVVTQNSMSELSNELDKIDTKSLRKIQEQLSIATGKDMSKAKEMVKIMEINASETSNIIKVVVIICTVGLIFLTEKGREMFKERKIIKENIDLEEHIKPKDYFIKNNEKELLLNKKLSTLDVSTDNVSVVDIRQKDKDSSSDEEEYENKQITNVVDDNLNNTRSDNLTIS